MMTPWLLAAMLYLVSPTQYAHPITVAQVGPDIPRVTEAENQRESSEHEQSPLKWNELRTEYDRLQLKAEDLQRQLEKTQQDLAGAKKTLGDVNTRLAAMEKEKSQMA